MVAATGSSSITSLTSNYIGSHIGMTGLWSGGVFYSKTRSMARFGLLALNKGIWGTDTLMRDTSYYRAMINTSQSFNPAYGYLWWLNGKSSYLAPGIPFMFNGSLIANAPADMFAALGKNDQKIYVVPSQRMVVVRTGNSAYGVALAFSPFDNLLWAKMDSLDYHCSYTFTGNGNWNVASNWANNLLPPANLQKQAFIKISPIAGGECVLNVPQTVADGSQLIVPANVKFRIQGNLNILNH